MAKARRFFTGTDSNGTQVERAESVYGIWFARSYGYNGYGMGFSKWEKTDDPDFETTGTNQYDGKTFMYPAPVCMWGWNKMREHSDIPRLRLPA